MLMISPQGWVHGGPRKELFDRGKSPAQRERAVLSQPNGYFTSAGFNPRP